MNSVKLKLGGQRPSDIIVISENLFLRNNPIISEGNKFLGICECGVKNTVSNKNLENRKWCRNIHCSFYQENKRFTNIERQLVLSERNCSFITSYSLPSNDLYSKNEINNEADIIDFICSCSFRQQMTWKSFKNERWCNYFSCPHKKNCIRKITTNLVRDYFEHEFYTVPDCFIYQTPTTNIIVQCVEKHDTITSLGSWIKGKRCKTCNEIKNKHNNITKMFKEIKLLSTRSIYDSDVSHLETLKYIVDEIDEYSEYIGGQLVENEGYRII
ncbi:MAG: hypothetical protein JKX76_01025 [Colwellia sp.]|nr:hypothetical protein [Colwellia sp.]